MSRPKRIVTTDVQIKAAIIAAAKSIEDLQPDSVDMAFVAVEACRLLTKPPEKTSDITGFPEDDDGSETSDPVNIPEGMTFWDHPKKEILELNERLLGHALPRDESRQAGRTISHQLRDAEKELEDAHSQFNAELADKVKRIRELEVQLDLANKEIEDLKNLMTNSQLAEHVVKKAKAQGIKFYSIGKETPGPSSGIARLEARIDDLEASLKDLEYRTHG